MALYNANSNFNQYKNSKVLTATPAELTLMLYEGAIKFCNVAIVAIEKKEMGKAHTNIMKAQKIIDHLRITLDMNYPVAKDFERIYEYIGWRLVQANIKKDIGMIEEALMHLRSIRDTWKEVMRINGKA